MKDKPLISAHEKISELTLRVVVLSIVLTGILAASNAYLALRLGILTSASIPAAIISMGILRFFKNATVLENNAVQTAASAGEAVAGGIVYTIPALIIIGYWHQFTYLTNFFIAVTGGVLGVLFSIPLRTLLVHDNSLKFPEGRAIAEVLKSTTQAASIRDIAMGGMIGAGFEFLQTGLKVFASDWSCWFALKKMIFGIGAGFSPTMLGAGYLVGKDMALSVFLGAILSWLVILPLLALFQPTALHDMGSVQAMALGLWSTKLRYVGIGAMLFAGIWTFVKLLKPLLSSMQASLLLDKDRAASSERTEKDIPMPFIVLGILAIAVFLFVFFQVVFPMKQVGFSGSAGPTVVFFAVVYVLGVGFLFSVITAYFSGLVGVTASPGSSVVIAGMLFVATALLTTINKLLPLPLQASQIQAAEAITIIIGAVVTGIAAIANDNTQDLKVGQLVGATPWKQQLMLLIGVVVSALVIPPVMQILFSVYGIAGVMPHPGMDASQSLPAPTAALMAAITQAVFQHSLPWAMLGLGALIIVMVSVTMRFFIKYCSINFSLLGVAIGMYLPLSTSIPLFVGGMIAAFAGNRLHTKPYTPSEKTVRIQRGTMIACGLVAGAALLDIVLAIPFSMLHSPDALSIVSKGWQPVALFLSVAATLALAAWMVKRVSQSR